MSRTVVSIAKSISRQLSALSAKVCAARMMMTIVAAAAVNVVFVNTLSAQDATVVNASAAVNAVVARARVQLDAGEGAAARTLMDSLVEATASGSLDKGEALFWRAAFSEQASDAEKDWRLLLIDVPLSPRVADAALRLAELERARGRAPQARLYVMRLLRDHPASPLRSRALLQMARSYLDESDSPHACGVLNVLRAEMPSNATEVKLQSDELALTCRSVQAIAFSPDAELPKAVAASAAPPTASTGTRDSTRDTVAAGNTSARGTTSPPGTGGTSTVVSPVKPVTTPPLAPPANTPGTRDGRWSVQLAAYDVRSQAEALVKRLSASGIDARVDGDVKPFRVRVGRYATQAEAAAALAKLKTKGQSGFVAEVNPR